MVRNTLSSYHLNIKLLSSYYLLFSYFLIKYVGTKTLLNLNLQKFSGQLEKTSQIKNAKKQIARLKTKLSNVGGENNA